MKKILLFLALSAPEFLLPATINIRPSDYLTSGLTYSLGSDLLKTSGTSYFYIDSTATFPKTLTITGIAVPQGSSWTSLQVSVDTDSADFVVSDTTGTDLVSQSSVMSTTTFNFSDKEGAKKGRTLTLKITFKTTNTRLYYVKLNYSSGGVFAFPAPYVISKGNLSISYDVTNDASVTLAIYDNRGILVKEIYANKNVSARSTTKVTDSWDGRNNSGQKVASGVYRILVSVKYVNQTNGQSSDYTSSFRVLVLR